MEEEKIYTSSEQSEVTGSNEATDAENPVTQDDQESLPANEGQNVDNPFVTAEETDGEEKDVVAAESNTEPETEEPDQVDNEVGEKEEKKEVQNGKSCAEPDNSKQDVLKDLIDKTTSLETQIGSMQASISSIDAAEQKITSEIKEIHKLYHNEFASRLKSMQDELDAYHKVDKGRAFDGILTAIARIYGNNETLADEVEDPKAKKNIRYMLLDLSDLLEEYGMSMQKSKPGDKRNPKFCQVQERIQTDDPAKHDTVVKSHNTGFYIENRTIIQERIDVYFYTANNTVVNDSSDSNTKDEVIKAEEDIENEVISAADDNEVISAADDDEE